MQKLKITQIGDSAAVILPKAMLERLKLVVGDELQLTNTEKGIELNPCTEFDEQMEIARKIMKKRHAVLRELAK